MNIFDHYRQRYEAAKDEEFTLQEFLTICRQDRSAYANAAERLLMAIGEPNMVDTALEPRLSRLFSNRVVARYPAFEEFYGMEDAIEQIVSYLKHAAQGLEEKKQILYLLGPVGGGKILAGGTPEVADAARAYLCPERQRRAQPGERPPAVLVQSAGRCADSG